MDIPVHLWKTQGYGHQQLPNCWKEHISFPCPIYISNFGVLGCARLHSVKPANRHRKSPMFLQVAWKPVPFLSVLPICATNARAGSVAIFAVFRSLSVFSSRTWRCSNFHRKFAIKKLIKFSKHAVREGFVHFLSKNCSNCFVVFDLSNCQGGVGEDNNVPWTCTHVWCYANWWLRDVNIPWTCTHVWCYANWWLRDVNILWTCTHVWCYGNWWLRDVNIPWTCTHAWCYANWWLRDVNILWNLHMFDATQIGGYPNSLCAQRSGKVNSSLMTYCRQWQWRNARVLCKDLKATTGNALKHWPNFNLVWKIGPVSSPPGCFCW